MIMVNPIPKAPQASNIIIPSKYYVLIEKEKRKSMIATFKFLAVHILFL